MNQDHYMKMVIRITATSIIYELKVFKVGQERKNEYHTKLNFLIGARVICQLWIYSINIQLPVINRRRINLPKDDKKIIENLKTLIMNKKFLLFRMQILKFHWNPWRKITELFSI